MSSDPTQLARGKLRLLVFEFAAKHIQEFNLRSSDNLHTSPQQVQTLASVLNQIISSIKHEAQQSHSINQQQQQQHSKQFCSELFNGFDELHNSEATDASVEKTTVELRQSRTDSATKIHPIYSNDFSTTYSRGFVDILCIRKEIGIDEMTVSRLLETDIRNWIEFYDVLKLTTTLMLSCPKEDDQQTNNQSTITNHQATLSYIADLCVNMLIKHKIVNFLEQNTKYLTITKQPTTTKQPPVMTIKEVLDTDCEVQLEPLELQAKLASATREDRESLTSSIIMVGEPEMTTRGEHTSSMSTDSWSHIGECAQKTTPETVSEVSVSSRNSSEEGPVDDDSPFPKENTPQLNIVESTATLKSDSSAATIIPAHLPKAMSEPGNIPLPASTAHLDTFMNSHEDMKKLITAASNSCLQTLNQVNENEADDEMEEETTVGVTLNIGMGQEEETEDQSNDQVELEDETPPRQTNFSIDSTISVQSEAASSVLTSVTPTTPPLACYNSMIEKEEDTLDSKNEANEVNEVDNENIIDNSNDTVTQEETENKIEAPVEVNDTHKAKDEHELKFEKSPAQTPTPERRQTRTRKEKPLQNVDVATAAAIGGAVAGLTAYLYLKLK